MITFNFRTSFIVIIPIADSICIISKLSGESISLPIDEAINIIKKVRK
jgi:hypothetical protein